MPEPTFLTLMGPKLGEMLLTLGMKSALKPGVDFSLKQLMGVAGRRLTELNPKLPGNDEIEKALADSIRSTAIFLAATLPPKAAISTYKRRLTKAARDNRALKRWTELWKESSALSEGLGNLNDPSVQFKEQFTRTFSSWLARTTAPLPKDAVRAVKSGWIPYERYASRVTVTEVFLRFLTQAIRSNPALSLVIIQEAIHCGSAAEAPTSTDSLYVPKDLDEIQRKLDALLALTQDSASSEQSTITLDYSSSYVEDDKLQAAIADLSSDLASTAIEAKATLLTATEILAHSLLATSTAREILLHVHRLKRDTTLVRTFVVIGIPSIIVLLTISAFRKDRQDAQLRAWLTQDQVNDEYSVAVADELRKSAVQSSSLTDEVRQARFKYALKEIAKQRHVSPKELEHRISLWASKRSRDPNLDPALRARAMYVQENFEESARLASEAASQFKEQLNSLEEEQRQAKLNLVSSLILAGDAFIAADKFDNALGKYKECLEVYDKYDQLILWDNIMDRIALTYEAQGNYPEALEVRETMYATNRVTLELEDHVSIDNLIRLADLIVEMPGGVQQAIPLFEAALVFSKSADDEISHLAARATDGLASANYNLRQLEVSKQYYARLAWIRTRLTGKLYPSTLQALLSKANIEREQGLLDDARETYFGIVESADSRPYGHKEESILALCSLAGLEVEQKLNFSGARFHAQRANALAVSLLPEEHQVRILTEMLISICDFFSVRDRGVDSTIDPSIELRDEFLRRYPDSKELIAVVLGPEFGSREAATNTLLEELKRKESSLELDSSSLIPILQDYASRLFQIDAFEESRAIYERAVAISDRHGISSREPDQLKLRSEYAKSVSKCGATSEAVSMQSGIVELYKDRFGAADVLTLQATNDLADYLSQANLLDRAEEVYSELIGTYKKSQPNYIFERANALRGLGQVLYKKNEIARCLPIFLEANEAIQSVSPEHLLTIPTRHDIGQCLQDLGHYSEATEHFRYVWSMRVKIRGTLDSSTLSSLTSLVKCLRELGKYGEAKDLVEPVYKALCEKHGVQSPEALDIAIHLASCLAGLGELDSAIHLQEKIVQNRKRQAEAPEIITALNNLAISFSDRNRVTEAELRYKEALEFSERPDAKSSIAAFRARNNYGIFLSNQDRYDEATKVYEAALKDYSENGTDDTLTELDCFRKLAGCLVKAGEQDAAVDLLRRARKVCERNYNLLDVPAVEVLNEMAVLLASTKKATEAASMLKTVVEAVLRDGAIPRHVDIPIQNFLNIERKAGRLNEAKDWALKVLQAYQTSLGSDDERTLSLLVILGWCIVESGDELSAIGLCGPTIDSWRSGKLPDSTPVSSLLNLMAVVYVEKRRGKEAIELLRAAERVAKKTRPEDSSFMAHVQLNLASALSFHDDFGFAIPQLEHQVKLASEENKWGDVKNFECRLAYALSRKGEYDTADSIFLRICGEEISTGNEGVLQIVQYRLWWTEALLKRSAAQSAQEVIEPALGLAKAELSADDPRTLKCEYALARALKLSGDSESAISLLEQTHSKMLRHWDSGHRQSIEAGEDLAVWLYEKGRTEFGLIMLRDLEANGIRTLGSDDYLVQSIRDHLEKFTRMSSQALPP